MVKIIKFDNEEDWLKSRLTRITGTRKIMPKRGNTKMIGYYELIAERLARPDDGQDPMERGHELEEEAIMKFEEKTKKIVDKSLTIWTRDDNDSISLSPDGMIREENGAVEVKCLSSAKHIKAFLEQEIPSDYEHQKLQYFVVNEKLETLYWIFYDPRFKNNSFFYLTFTREELKFEISEYLEFQQETLKEVNDIVNKLSF